MDEISTIIKNLVRNSPAANAVVDLLSPFGDVYVVGGAVRDVLLKKRPKDLDLVAKVDEDTIKSVLGKYPKAKLNKTGKQFPVYRFTYQDDEVEIALPRMETKVGDGNKDWKITTDPNLPIEKDLERRDFTANAIAVNAQTGEVVDPFNGIEDVKKGRLHVISENSFKDDSSRTLRALSALSRHGLYPDDETKEQLRKYAPELKKIAPEILGAEFDKFIGGNDPHGAISLARDSGILEHFLPDVHQAFGFDQKNPHHNLDLGEHLIAVLKNLAARSEDTDLRIAALFHDIGKPASMWEDEQGRGHFYRGKDGQGANHEEVGAEMAEKILRELRYPANRISRIKNLITHHMFPVFNTPKGARKFLNQVGSYETAQDLLTLKEADHMGKGKDGSSATTVDVMRNLVEDENSASSAFSIKDLAVNGNDITNALGIVPGPMVGAILKRLTDIVIDNPQLNTREGLLEITKSLYKNKVTARTLMSSVQTTRKAIRKVAAWRDVEMKAKRLKDGGQVVVNNNQPNIITGTVQGDHGTYEVEIWRENPQSASISHWSCGCAWGQYAWGRTRMFKKFEGRPCSHVMAMFWQSRSEPVGYFGPTEGMQGETFSFEPDQPNYQVAEQGLSQVTNEPEPAPEDQPLEEPEEPQKTVPEPNWRAFSKWRRSSKWKRSE